MKFFPDYKIVKYKHNPLFESIFQARFPDIASIPHDTPIEFQSDIRELGYHIFQKEVPSNTGNPNESETNLDTKLIFRADERGLRVILAIDSIAIIRFKDFSNIEEFENDFMEILEKFNKHYKFTKFIGIDLIHRNMFNNTFTPYIDVDLNNIIPDYIFPELKSENLGEIDSLRKTSTFKYGNIITQVTHILSNLSGEYGYRKLYNEKSFVVDAHCLYNSEIKEVSDVSSHYRNIANICWNILQYSINEELREKLV